MLKIQYAQNIAGTDEAGRGCLAGPVTAAAVIFPKYLNLPELNDSKKLTEKKRYYLRPKIEKLAVSFAVTHVFQEEIDEINIPIKTTFNIEFALIFKITFFIKRVIV